MPCQHLLIGSAVKAAAVKETLNNAASQVAPAEQVIGAVNRCSPVSVSVIKMSNVSMFVWNRGIRANIARMLAAIVSNRRAVSDRNLFSQMPLLDGRLFALHVRHV